jgi:hypothetical protein
MTDKPISENLVDHILSIKPGSKVETRDGKECLVIPEYDVHSDQITEYVRPILKGRTEPKFKPGDVLGVENTAGKADIVDLPSKLFGVKKDPDHE